MRLLYRRDVSAYTAAILLTVTATALSVVPAWRAWEVVALCPGKANVLVFALG